MTIDISNQNNDLVDCESFNKSLCPVYANQTRRQDVDRPIAKQRRPVS